MGKLHLHFDAGVSLEVFKLMLIDCICRRFSINIVVIFAHYIHCRVLLFLSRKCCLLITSATYVYAFERQIYSIKEANSTNPDQTASKAAWSMNMVQKQEIDQKMKIGAHDRPNENWCS